MDFGEQDSMREGRLSSVLLHQMRKLHVINDECLFYIFNHVFVTN